MAEQPTDTTSGDPLGGIADGKAVGVPGPPADAQRLLASSRGFARRAIAAYAEESWDEFHLDLAVAVEHLAKAALASQHPVLVMDGAHLDGVLHAIGLGAQSRVPAAKVKTISLTEALDRLPRVLGAEVRVAPSLARLVDARNALAHFGHSTRLDEEALLADVARLTEVLLTRLGVTTTDFWQDGAELVGRHVQHRLAALEAAYLRRIDVAKRHFAEFVEVMDEPIRQVFLATKECREPSGDFSTFPAECPACDHLGALSGDPEPHWEPDYDYSDGEVSVSGVYVETIDLSGSSFRCGVCRLSLDSDELEFAGLADKTLTDEDFDVAEASEFFSEPFDDWDPD